MKRKTNYIIDSYRAKKRRCGKTAASKTAASKTAREGLDKGIREGVALEGLASSGREAKECYAPKMKSRSLLAAPRLQFKPQTVDDDELGPIPEACRRHLESLMHEGVLEPCADPAALCNFKITLEPRPQLLLDWSHARNTEDRPFEFSQLLAKAQKYPCVVHLELKPYQWRLDEKSSRHLAINTHLGVHTFTAAPKQLQPTLTFADRDLTGLFSGSNYTVCGESIQLWAETLLEMTTQFSEAIRVLDLAKLELDYSRCFIRMSDDPLSNVLSVAHCWYEAWDELCEWEPSLRSNPHKNPWLRPAFASDPWRVMNIF